MSLLGSVGYFSSVDEAIAQAERNIKYAKYVRDVAKNVGDESVLDNINWAEIRKMSEPTDKVTEMLAVRKSHYGDYADNARVTQALMDVLMTGARSGDLNAMHKEGLHMIAHKMSRIVNGDADLVDSWYDIEGYARCVRERIPT